jgi:hypothetical protein
MRRFVRFPIKIFYRGCVCVDHQKEISKLPPPPMIRCATGEVVYIVYGSKSAPVLSVDKRCHADHGSYQMCGLLRDSGESVYTVASDGTIALCGYQLCVTGGLWKVCSLRMQV